MREETKRRIRAIVDRLHYSPHGTARSLITRTTSTIGLLLPDIHGEFFSELIRGADLTARRSGYHLLVSSSHSDKEEIEAVLRTMRGRVDGLIAMSPEIRAQGLQRNLPEAFPIVLLNCPVNERSADSINVDNHGGAFAMVRHLAVLGHRRIAHIRGAAKNYDARERLRGYRDAMKSFVGAAPAELVTEGDFSDEAGYRAGMRLLTMASPPTAIFAANDAMAIGCLAALRGAGRRVPEDFALAGFDDIPIARFVTPPLTSVRVSIAKLGARALERVLAAIRAKNGWPRRQETLPVTLVVRSSCGASAGRSRREQEDSDFRRRRMTL